MKKILMAVLICLLTVGFAFAAEKGAVKDAQDLIDKAAAFYKANGAEKSWRRSITPKGNLSKAMSMYLYGAQSM